MISHKGSVSFDSSIKNGNLTITYVDGSTSSGGEITKKNNIYIAHPYGLDLTSNNCNDLAKLLDYLNSSEYEYYASGDYFRNCE